MCDVEFLKPIELLRKNPLLRGIKRTLSHYVNVMIREPRFNIIRNCPMFQPFTSGSVKGRSMATLTCINQTIPNLTLLAKTLKTTMAREIEVRQITSFVTTARDQKAAEEIKELFNKYQSDKSSAHNYHFFYGPILRGLLSSGNINGILEIGLGTPNTQLLSNMGSYGKPGASLRAFRDFTDAQIYGADIDRTILFEERNIQTFFVDQTDPESFLKLGLKIPSNLDLVIDDGLHSINTNIATLQFGITKIRKGGWVVIEDISPMTIPLWELIMQWIPDSFKCHLIQTSEHYFLFAIQKK